MSKTIEFNIFKGSESGDVNPDTIRRTIQPSEVFVEISHAGLCGTDRLFKNKGIALGHEGAGTVRDVGSAVTNFKVGDKVGFGWVRKVCGHCDFCVSGHDQYCQQREQYGKENTEIGAFATHAVWHESMLIKLPDDLEPEYAAPLMCGGATVWCALTCYDIKPGDRVGIQGIGGLGHMAIQFASKLGCDVVVFSSSAAKKDEAKGLGANEFHTLENGAVRDAVRPVKHLLWCGNEPPDFSKIFPIMSPDSTIYLLTVSTQQPPLPVMPLISNGIRIQGSAVASRVAVRKMLRFVSLHRIRPIIMTWPMTKDGIQAAFQILEQGKMRYRGVIVGQRHLMGKPAVEKMG
ncbi:hypothetical protein CNMCM5623_005524 [Aspergillus felis]|uniref:Enoyl reductase (ER) domain-containing protein n=1 Tax=Aspergillus felis TaxID=1287682 RepID=A0A8H6QQY4_9EURO|nr:hypothetical protein CNMCM5623_005524 [Aspergillus felis]KAF7178471.1 hypothetical protein CNMCM7691_007167 [Aspergillus felis]